MTVNTRPEGATVPEGTALYLHAYCLNEDISTGDIFIGPLVGWGVVYGLIRACDADDSDGYASDWDEIMTQGDNGLWYLIGQVPLERPGSYSMQADPSRGRYSDIYGENYTAAELAHAMDIRPGSRLMTVNEITHVTHTQEEADAIAAAEMQWDADYEASQKEQEQDLKDARAAEEAAKLRDAGLTKITSLEQLIELAREEHGVDVRLALAGGVAYSRKTITFEDDGLSIMNWIDDSTQWVAATEEELRDKTHLMIGIESGALYAEVYE